MNSGGIAGQRRAARGKVAKNYFELKEWAVYINTKPVVITYNTPFKGPLVGGEEIWRTGPIRNAIFSLNRYLCLSRPGIRVIMNDTDWELTAGRRQDTKLLYLWYTAV